ncbi:alginate export family protein [bacterium]|nr:alginate export family protein [bacterium]
MRRLLICGVILAALGVRIPSADAQHSAEEIRRERQEALDELRRTEKSWETYQRSPGWRMNFGSWLSSSYAGSDQDDRDRSTPDLLDHVWDHDLRFYASGRSGSGRTRAYARLGTTYTLNSRTTPSIRKHDWIQPSVEMAYLEHDFGGAPFKQRVTAGRQYVEVKNSLVFALVADGLKYDLKTPRQAFEAFLVRQQPGDNNIDFLSRNPGRTKRWFSGMQYFWHYTQNQSLNFFSVWNKDGNPETADDAGQKHQFDSLYLGATFFGRVFSRLHYQFQYILESGKTFSDSNANNPAPGSRVSVDASAIHARLAYYFSGALNLSVHTDYLYGSGDGDAVGNIFSTTGGSGSLNGSGTGGKDSRFMAFGGANLGFALAPTLTNIRVSKTGFGFKPFGWSRNRLWSGFIIHPDLYYYWRDKASGATSDPYMIRGAGASKKIGHEFDVWMTWRLMSDVKYQLKIGKFYPGAAYLTKNPETLIRFKISVDL